MVGPKLPDATPGTVGPFRLVIPVVPPADPEGLQLELDDVFIEGARSDGAEAEATVRDDGTADNPFGPRNCQAAMMRLD